MAEETENSGGTEGGGMRSPFVTALQSQNPAWVVEVKAALGETTIVVPGGSIVEICRFLKTAPGLEFNMLADLCGVDRGIEEEPRFEVNYHLLSLSKKHRVRLKVLLSDSDPRVDTVTGVWKTANWHERETYDLMGITFDGHPDLRRILMPDDETGHPLRKDYPLRGFEPYSMT